MARRVKRLKQRKDGRYSCTYRGKAFYGKTEKEVLEKREDFIRRVVKKACSVEEYSREWLPTAKATVCKRTYKGYSHMMDVLNKVIGKKRPASVLPSDIKKVYSTQYKNASNSHIKHAKNLYTALFESMKDDGVILVNPCKSVSARPHKGYEGTHRVITDEERYYIETTDHPLRPLLLTMLYAGLRNSEAMAVDIDRDVDFENKTISVNFFRHIDENSAVISKNGKNDNAKRSVRLFPQLEKVLAGKHGLLASDANGGILSRSGWNSAWLSYVTAVETRMNGCRKRWYGKRTVDIENKKKYEAMIREGKKDEAEQYKLPPWKKFTVRPYDLRHSFCSFCKDLGIEDHVLQTWMGHSDSTMIMRVYDHVSKAREDKEFKKVQDNYEATTKSMEPTSFDSPTNKIVCFPGSNNGDQEETSQNGGIEDKQLLLLFTMVKENRLSVEDAVRLANAGKQQMAMSTTRG